MPENLLPELTVDIAGLQIQYNDIQAAIVKLNERFNGMGKLMMESNARLESVIEQASQKPIVRVTYPNKSMTIGKIAAALSKAQREIGGIAASGSANRGSFTTLEDMEEACAPVLEKYELSVSCQLITNEYGEFVLVMVLCHASDEWFESRALLREDGSGQSLPLHQKIGAAEKYLKRYMYRAILCLADNSKD